MMPRLSYRRAHIKRMISRMESPWRDGLRDGLGSAIPPTTRYDRISAPLPVSGFAVLLFSEED
jgi:hypothetical protein